MKIKDIKIFNFRGIPNNYGVFEQFAEYISVGLVKRGHDLVVTGYSTLKKSVSMYLNCGGGKPTKPLHRRFLFELLCHSPYLFIYFLRLEKK